MTRYRGKRQMPNQYPYAFLLWLLVIVLLITVKTRGSEETVEETPQETVKEEITVEEPIEKEETQTREAITLEPEWGFDFSYVCRVVGAECRGESVEGIMAVCQCIYDTSVIRGINPEQVVKEPGQYAPPMESEFYDGGEMVVECMLRVFSCGERVTDEPIQYFCTPAHNSFHRTAYQYVMTIGGHEFYKARG